MDQKAFDALKKTVEINDHNTNYMFILAGLGIALLGIGVLRQRHILVKLIKNNNELADFIEEVNRNIPQQN